MTSLRDRLERLCIPEPNSGCWLWMGAVNFYNYGKISWKERGGTFAAHRASWIAYRGEIPNEMCVCHTCDNPYCINPDHLWLGSVKDNARDKMAKGRGGQTGAKGELNRHAKITVAQAGLIKSDPRPVREIAVDFDLSPSTIYRIKSGMYWTEAKLMS